jgi:hypothetical protein
MIRFIAELLAASVLVGVVMVLFALWMRPDVATVPTMPSPERLAEISRSRDMSFDPDNPPVVHVDVDYSEGERARWYPRTNPPSFPSRA